MLYGAIDLESDNGLKNTRGTIAMARTSDPYSASSQFYVNLKNNTNRNFKSNDDPGYAVFGKVVQGLSVIDKIGHVATSTPGGMDDVPTKNVVLTKAQETTTATVLNKTGLVLVGGVEAGAKWEYTTDGGDTWTRGLTTGKKAYTFTLAKDVYEAGEVLVRATDKASNISRSGTPSASIIAGFATAVAGNDTYIVRDSTDQVVEGVSGGTDLVKSRIAVGPQQGRKVFTLQTLPACDELFDDGFGKVAGFSLHAGVAARINARSSNGCVGISAGRPSRKSACHSPRLATSVTS